MLDFLKKLFRGEEKQEIDFFELHKWLLPKLDGGIKEDFNQLAELSGSLDESLKRLEQVDIDSMQVEEKLKGFVTGNRKAYIASLNNLRRLLEPPESLDSHSIKLYCKNLEEEMMHFGKRTTKNYYIMQNLIGKELEEIKQKLSQIDKILKTISEKADKLELMESILSRLKDAYEYIDQKDVRDKKFIEAKKERQALLQKEKEFREEIEAFKNGSEYKQLLHLKEKRSQLENESYRLKRDFNNSFVSISRPLRKLANMYNDKLLQKYIDNPFSTFLEDKDMEIISLLNSLKKELKCGKIKEKNPEKMLSQIDNLNKEHLLSIKQEFSSKLKQLKQCNNEIDKNQFEYRLQDKISSLSKIEDDLAEANEMIEKLEKRQISKDIEIIENSLKKLGYDVEVKNAPYNN